jgi:hypothetical protein
VVFVQAAVHATKGFTIETEIAIAVCESGNPVFLIFQGGDGSGLENLVAFCHVVEVEIEEVQLEGANKRSASHGFGWHAVI